MSARKLPAGDPGSGATGAFLARVRSRLIVSSLLGAAAFAAAVNEALRWSAAAAVVYLGWNVPVLGFLGLLVLAALVLPARRRWTLAAAAAHADARLGLRDRLASWVDFRGRAEIPAAIRRAQAGETARALAGATPAAAAPIPPWRAAGPLLLAACLLYQFFLPAGASRFSPLVNVIVPVWRQAPPGAEAPRAGRTPDGIGPPTGQGADGTAAQPPGKGAKTHGQDAAGGKPPEAPAAGTAVDAETKLASGDSRKSGDRTGPAGKDGAGDAREPGRIESERVGERLARVVDPLYRAGGGPSGAAPPSGVATFHLLPQAGSAGAGGGPGGEAVAPEPVRVDLDAVPAPYRPIVKAYFDQLARAAAPAGGPPNP